MFSPLDGPSKQGALSVDTITPQQVKVDATPLSERQVVTIEPVNGKLWVLFGDGITTPTASDMQNKGFRHPKTIRSYEAGDRQVVWVLAQSGTVDVRIAERA